MILRDADKKDKAYVKKLYKGSFPAIERWPLWAIFDMQKEGKVRVLVADEQGERLGIAIISSRRDTVLLNYLAVDPEKRGRGVGTQMLSALGMLYRGNRLLLEIEKPDENKPHTVRRKEFYLRNGLSETGLDISLVGVPMEVLSIGGNVNEDEYLALYYDLLGKALTSTIVKVF